MRVYRRTGPRRVMFVGGPLDGQTKHLDRATASHWTFEMESSEWHICEYRRGRRRRVWPVANEYRFPRREE